MRIVDYTSLAQLLCVGNKYTIIEIPLVRILAIKGDFRENQQHKVNLSLGMNANHLIAVVVSA
ncbi:MAG: hypothetical protein JKY95_17970 [Planctomycetaceae bacterium]|nr:hypothetical protein [Planctomycetaceae bacterium]